MTLALYLSSCYVSMFQIGLSLVCLHHAGKTVHLAPRGPKKYAVGQSIYSKSIPVRVILFSSITVERYCPPCDVQRLMGL